MRRCVFYYVFLSAVLVFVPTSFADIACSLSFDIDKLTMEERQNCNGIKTILLGYEKYPFIAEENAPLLPAYYHTFSFPKGCDSRLTIEDILTETHSIGLLAGIEKSPSVDGHSSDEYIIAVEKEDLFPRKVVEIVDDGYLNGCERMITVRVAFAQYDTRTKGLIFNTKVDYKIVEDSTQKAEIRPLFKKYERRMTRAGNAYQYMIVTTDSMTSAFDRLVSWKRLKGLDAGVVTIESILNDPGITGDTISLIYDDAGKLRQFLTRSWQMGTEYVLLAGQDSIVPVRYGTYYKNTINSFTDSIPTDLYYCDLNGNWNYDGDIYYGEFGDDRIEVRPELFVGRLLCKNRQEIINYIDKVIRYELYPGNGDGSYLVKAFYTQSDWMQYLQEANSAASISNSIYSTQTIYSEYPDWNSVNPTFPKGVDVIDEMKSKYGLYVWDNHGMPDGVATCSNRENEGPYYGVTPLDTVQGFGLQPESGNGLDCLNNKKYPSIMYSFSCHNIPFDKYLYTNNLTPYNLGESFTVGGQYGGPIFIGNTRNGYTQESIYLFTGFISNLMSSSFHIGRAYAISKTGGGITHKSELAHNLLGCPELELWTDYPSNIEVYVDENTDDSITVTTEESDCHIHINGVFGSNYQETQIGDECGFTNLPTNYMVSVTKHDFSPEIFPCMFQNEDVYGSHYMLVSNAFLGESVSSMRQNGELVIKDGASVEIEYSGTVFLQPGFSVEKGAEFTVKKRD